MDDLLTTRQVQQLLKVDRITVYRMVQDGRLKGIKIGQQWRFPLSEVEHLTGISPAVEAPQSCLLYTSDAADDLPCVDPGGRRIIKKKTFQRLTIPTETQLDHVTNIHYTQHTHFT